MRSIYDISYKDLEKFFIDNGYKKFKAKQVYDWLYKKRVKSFNEMHNISKNVIELLNNNFYFSDIEILTKKEDVDVKKYLFGLSDKNKVEAVLMYHDYGNSLCISTQVGCNMGCHFCESGRLKKVTNLYISFFIYY